MKHSLTLMGRNETGNKGTLNLGNYSKANPPPVRRVEIHASNEDLVKYQEKLRGDENYYTLILEVENLNDSPAGFDVITDNDETPASN